MSYGITAEQIDTMHPGELWELIDRAVPAEHRDFLAGLNSQAIIGDYAFVHAGIQPGVPLEEQEETDLYWIRDAFLNFEEPHPYMIVHGHSIREDVEMRTNRIGIDTGALCNRPPHRHRPRGHRMLVPQHRRGQGRGRAAQERGPAQEEQRRRLKKGRRITPPAPSSCLLKLVLAEAGLRLNWDQATCAVSPSTPSSGSRST